MLKMNMNVCSNIFSYITTAHFGNCESTGVYLSVLFSDL